MVSTTDFDSVSSGSIPLSVANAPWQGENMSHSYVKQARCPQHEGSTGLAFFGKPRPQTEELKKKENLYV